MLFTGLGSANIVWRLLQHKSDLRQEENLKQYILLSSTRISSIQVLVLRLLHHIQHRELKSIAKIFFILVEFFLYLIKKRKVVAIIILVLLKNSCLHSWK